MIAPTFSAWIDGEDIQVEITPSQDLTNAVFCFSLLAPVKVVSGGSLIRTEGGYAEVSLPDLTAGATTALTLAYAGEGYAPANRAWLPLGAYIRCDQGLVELPVLPSGVRAVDPCETPDPKGLRLIPPPQRWTPAGGTLAVSSFSIGSTWFDRVAQLCERANLDPFLSKDGTPVDMTFDPSMHSDGYRIEISEQGIAVSHGGFCGAHYAGITLAVLRQTHQGQLPLGEILDVPRFNWRGQHLDCARHFFSKDTIFRLLDVMAFLKLNRFHWHFSDDEALRLELDSCPDIVRETRFRGEARTIPGVFGGGIKSGGSYSQQDAQEIVDRAKSLCIEVMPEIEFPAHALALAKVRPELRDPDDTGSELSVQGYKENVVNPAMPAVFPFFEAIVDELADIFPFKHVHLGGDELPPGTWAGSAALEALRKENNLSTPDDVEGWALNRLARHLAQKDVRSAAWEEAAKGKDAQIGNNAILFSWTGQQAGVDATKAGYDIVMCPAQHVYMDMAHSDDPDDWGANWAAFVPFEETVNWTVIPEDADPDHVIGVEGAFWGEFTCVDREMEPMMAPRILGVAAMAWSEEALVREDGFVDTARAFCDILTSMNWAWNGACFPKGS